MCIYDDVHLSFTPAVYVTHVYIFTVDVRVIANGN